MSELKVKIDEFSFQKDGDYLNVVVHSGENWIELKTDTSGSFPIESLEELETIYRTLKANFPQS